MVGGVGDTWHSLRSVFLNPALRRMQVALTVSMVGDWAFSTAVTVYAYQAGGAALVGGWFAARLVLMALLAPMASSVADRFPRKTVLVVSDLVRACSSPAPACSCCATPRRWPSSCCRRSRG